MIQPDALLEPSDEEVLALPESDNSDDDISSDDEEDGAGTTNLRASKPYEEDEEKDEDEEDSYQGWGDTRDAYYGAETIDTEQAALEEEAEAKRLQQKQLQSMNEADFGFDDGEWQDRDAEMAGGMEEMDQDVVKEVLPELQIRDDMGPEERLKVLRQRYPEFEPIAKEFVELQDLVEQLAVQAKKASTLIQRRKELQSNRDADQQRSHPAIVKYQALAAYMGITAMYFAILTSTADANGTALAKAPLELRDHPIMDSLLKSRQLWIKVEATPIPDIDKDLATLDLQAAQAQAQEAVIPKSQTTTLAPLPTNTLPQPRKPKKPSKTQLSAAAAQHAAHMQALEADLATLTTSISHKTPKRTKPRSTATITTVAEGEDSDLGEETNLTAREAAAKASRKKTLGFYTSQIAQRSRKRGDRGREVGGDVDIPYRERLKERRARLAERKGMVGEQGDDWEGGDGAEGRVGAEVRAGAEDEAYYDLVAARAKKRKEDRKAAAEAYAAAQRAGGRVVEEEGIGADGKRKISYQIEKNKGLTPFRRKEVRNPRIKKRMKFEEKKKKLASVRAVYKGGEGKGGYGGELTGIKTSLVKSVKF